jgi:hypothetical protein
MTHEPLPEVAEDTAEAALLVAELREAEAEADAADQASGAAYRAMQEADATFQEAMESATATLRASTDAFARATTHQGEVNARVSVLKNDLRKARGQFTG